MMNKINIGVFGGGGSLGAYTAGVISKVQPNYDLCVGTSTGSLLAALTVCKKFDVLAEAYESVTPENIFDRNPFNSRGRIKLFNALRKVIGVKTSLARTTGLEKLIRKYYTRGDHDQLKLEGNMFVVTATRVDVKPGGLTYFSSSDHDYETMVKAILASCSVPIAMNPVKIGLESYLDGGIVEGVPVKYVRDNFRDGRYNLDVFVHHANADSVEVTGKQLRNIFTLSANVFDIMMNEIRDNDMANVPEHARVFELPYNLTDNPLLFDQKTMANWVKMGRYYGGQIYKLQKKI